MPRLYSRAENLPDVRSTLRIVFLVLVGIALFLVSVIGWFLFYSGDLPDTGHLREFAPATRTQVRDRCLDAPVQAVPFDQIGRNLLDAVSSAELGTDHATNLSLRISQSLFCEPEKMLSRQLKELRTANQIKRRFTDRELLTIYLNRVYLGECGKGVEAASQCLFHKPASSLTTAQAALIAGMIRSPSRFSPLRHPERALERRNQVIDAMVAAGTLSLGTAQSAKTAPLLD